MITYSELLESATKKKEKKEKNEIEPQQWDVFSAVKVILSLDFLCLSQLRSLHLSSLARSFVRSMVVFVVFFSLHFRALQLFVSNFLFDSETVYQFVLVTFRIYYYLLSGYWCMAACRWYFVFASFFVYFSIF